jgi:hypothetical protein
MRYLIRRGSREIGTFDDTDIQAAFQDGRLGLGDVAHAEGAAEGVPVSYLLGSAMTMPLERPRHLTPEPAPGAAYDPGEAERFRAKLAGYERLSATVWLVIAIVQCLSVVAIVAGIWNVFASISRFRLSRAIREGHPGIARAYEEGLWMLIVMGCVNFFLGGFIAAAWIGFDFFVRRRVLANRHLLEHAA